MRKLRIFSLVLALLMILPLAVACKKKQTVEYEAIDPADAIEHDDFTSVYDKIGSKVTIDMVEEDSAVTPRLYAGASPSGGVPAKVVVYGFVYRIKIGGISCGNTF